MVLQFCHLQGRWFLNSSVSANDQILQSCYLAGYAITHQIISNPYLTFIIVHQFFTQNNEKKQVFSNPNSCHHPIPPKMVLKKGGSPSFWAPKSSWEKRRAQWSGGSIPAAAESLQEIFEDVYIYIMYIIIYIFIYIYEKLWRCCLIVLLIWSLCFFSWVLVWSSNLKYFCERCMKDGWSLMNRKRGYCLLSLGWFFL